MSMDANMQEIVKAAKGVLRHEDGQFGEFARLNFPVSVDGDDR